MFPNTVIEALAYGNPVVATAVCGIPGAGKRLPPRFRWRRNRIPHRRRRRLSLAAGLVCLLGDLELRQRLGRNAHEDARERFDIRRQAKDYLAWYDEILARIPSRDLRLPVAD